MRAAPCDSVQRASEGWGLVQWGSEEQGSEERGSKEGGSKERGSKERGSEQRVAWSGDSRGSCFAVGVRQCYDIWGLGKPLRSHPHRLGAAPSLVPSAVRVDSAQIAATVEFMLGAVPACRDPGHHVSPLEPADGAPRQPRVGGTSEHGMRHAWASLLASAVELDGWAARESSAVRAWPNLRWQPPSAPAPTEPVT